MDNTPKKAAEAEGARLVAVLNSGVLSSLRDNAAAYGYSVTITVSFAVVSALNTQAMTPWRILFFALGAAVAFFVVELVSSRVFSQVAGAESERVEIISGAADVLSILAASGAAIGLAHLPGLAAWPATSFGATVIFLVAGGVDVLIARSLARGD